MRGGGDVPLGVVLAGPPVRSAPSATVSKFLDLARSCPVPSARQDRSPAPRPLGARCGKGVILNHVLVQAIRPGRHVCYPPTSNETGCLQSAARRRWCWWPWAGSAAARWLPGMPDDQKEQGARSHADCDRLSGGYGNRPGGETSPWGPPMPSGWTKLSGLIAEAEVFSRLHVGCTRAVLRVCWRTDSALSLDKALVPPVGLEPTLDRF